MAGNPYVPVEEPPAPPEINVRDAVFGDAEMLVGPSSPAAAPDVVGRIVNWPLVEVGAREGLVVTGLHGGAGTSTLVHLLNLAEIMGDDAWRSTDAGQGWPVSAGWTRPRPSLAVIAVYRPHHRGVSAATEFARAWASGGLADSKLLGIVAVDDGPRLLDTQRRAVRRIAQMTPRGWHIPWQEEWRVTAPAAGTLPRRIRKTLRSIRKATPTEGVKHHA